MATPARSCSAGARVFQLDLATASLTVPISIPLVTTQSENQSDVFLEVRYSEQMALMRTKRARRDCFFVGSVQLSSPRVAQDSCAYLMSIEETFIRLDHEPHSPFSGILNMQFQTKRPASSRRAYLEYSPPGSFLRLKIYPDVSSDCFFQSKAKGRAPISIQPPPPPTLIKNPHSNPIMRNRLLNARWGFAVLAPGRVRLRKFPPIISNPDTVRLAKPKRRGLSPSLSAGRVGSGTRGCGTGTVSAFAKGDGWCCGARVPVNTSCVVDVPFSLRLGLGVTGRRLFDGSMRAEREVDMSQCPGLGGPPHSPQTFLMACGICLYGNSPLLR